MQLQTTVGQPPLRPLGLLAEHTYRCPLGCPYCSNPNALESRGYEIDTATWARVFAEAADLGVLQVHLFGRRACHAAETIPGLEFWSVRKHSLADFWHSSPAFNAFRGTDWMKEPCASCPRRFEDFGGCRCQGRSRVTRVRLIQSVTYRPITALMADLAQQRDDAPYIYRRQRADGVTAAESALVQR
jgi:MoaA/NifB/PqqE/SkfB family radical SAM enzyme